MSNDVRLNGPFNIWSPADQVFQHFIRENNHVFSEQRDYHVSAKYPAELFRFQIEWIDPWKKIVTMSILGDPISKIYKTVKATVSIKPWGYMSHSRFKYHLTCEKINPDVEADPMLKLEIIDILVAHIKFIDASLYDLNNTVNFINANHPPDECFTAITEAFKDDDADVEIKENRTATMSLKSSHCLMDKFNTLKITTTITPKEDSSRVEWTIEAEKISDYIEDPKLSLNTANLIHEKIQTMIHSLWK